MGFPTSPNNGDQYENALGTIYEYVAAEDKWIIVLDTAIADLASHLADTDDPHESRVLNGALSTDGDYSGITMEGVDVDTGTTFGAPLYLNTDGNYDACDASAIATMICSALYLASSKVLLLGSIREDDWNWTVGGKIYVSETTGELTQTAPSTASAIVQCVGIALTADSILFNPSMDWVEVA